MNLQEFLALEIGDKIENAMTSGEGIVSKVADYGHRIRDRIVSIKWLPSDIEFSYSLYSTAWFHWSRVEEIDPGPQF